MLPVLSKLGFKALNFTSSTLAWDTWPISDPECGQHYTIKLVISDDVYNIITVATSLNVTGLTRGEEYTITVSAAHSCKTISMTLEGSAFG